MAVTLPPPPYKVPIADRNGNVSHQWVAWFRELFRRAGGTNALSNTELADIGIDQVNQNTSDLASLTLTVTSQGTSIAALQTKDNDFGQGPVL